jgi:1,4-dihydroxy-2-naphthoyl-CoA hydrolase
MIPHKNIKVEELNTFLKDSMAEALEMEVCAIGPDSLTMKMPVNHKTKQPLGLLNGGASLALAENVASLAGNLIVNPDHYCVGLEINGNHLKSARSGFVYARATPLHLGKKTHVWQIHITNDSEELVCVSRMTLAVLPKN